ncbi:MAG: MoaD/ThiS family protein [Alphaproteobacteria bacterium]|nr:MoaD/ThiS family protein [Alphaproteobacteria bacterium]
MARVILSRSFADLYAKGQVEHEVPGLKVRHLVRTLDERFPGIAKHLENGVAVAIDGVLHQNAWLEEVGLDSEVCFMPAIEGG